MDSQSKARIIEFGLFRFDRDAGKLTKGGVPIRLRGMPLTLLQRLLDVPGEAVSRAELQRLLWRGVSFKDFEQGLNSAMNLLRQTLGDSAERAFYIETISGEGYRFSAPIREASGGGEVTGERSATLLLCGSPASAVPEANDQYNLGVGFLGVHNDLPSARKAFERAVSIDPGFAAARLQTAMCPVLEIYNGTLNDWTVLIEAEEHLHRAGPSLARSEALLLAAETAVYLTQGRMHMVPVNELRQWWQRSGKQSAAPPVWVAIVLMLIGEVEEPVAMLRERIQANPLENPSRMLLGELLRTSGSSGEAIAVLERVLQQSPRFVPAAWFLSMAYLDEGLGEEAVRLLEGLRSELESNYLWRHAMAIVLADRGRFDEASTFMDDGTLQFAKLYWAVTAATADFYALIGDTSRALEWLQLAIARGDEREAYFRCDQRLVSLRNTRQFESMLNSLRARRGL